MGNYDMDTCVFVRLFKAHSRYDNGLFEILLELSQYG